MTAGGYEYLRATDADRDNVQSVLQNAYSEGRLTWEEFDARSTAVANAKTYGQLAAVTADLPARNPGVPQSAYPQVPGAPRPTNGLAVASLVCGIAQVVAWGVGPIAAIILGHMARHQIRRTGETGNGMALTGLVLGYAGLIVSLLLIVAIIGLAVSVSSTVPPPPG